LALPEPTSAKWGAVDLSPNNMRAIVKLNCRLALRKNIGLITDYSRIHVVDGAHYSPWRLNYYSQFCPYEFYPVGYALQSGK
jgi:hypothetical protein